MEVERTILKGEVLFKEGDPGGGVFLISEGRLEVYRDNEGSHLRLAVMEENELLGLVTCLSEKPRTASVKALENCIIKEVPFDKLRASVDNLPSWVKLIIKEYSILLTRTLDRSSAQMVTRDRLVNNIVNDVFFSKIIAGVLSKGFTTARIADSKNHCIPYADVISKISGVLNILNEDIEKIIQIFTDEGLLKLNRNSNLGSKEFTLESLEGMSSYTSFMKDVLKGVNQKYLKPIFIPEKKEQLSTYYSYVLKMA